jgi:hypothetical protein
MTISPTEVLARWGYSEILDGTQANNYQGDGVDAVREKRRHLIDFGELSPRDQYLLAFHCGWIRPVMLRFFAGIDTFDLMRIKRSELGDLFVPSNVWRDSNGEYVQFRKYVNTSTDEAGDARLVTPPPEYIAPTDALTVGCANGKYVLTDGYHRATTFWRFGPRDATLEVYWPRVPTE